VAADGTTSLGSGETDYAYEGGRLDRVAYDASHDFLPGVKLDYKALENTTNLPTG
jgi:hypothetical protein